MGMRRSAVASAVVLVSALLGSASAVRAQSNDEVNAAVQFNFSNPGARSLALGGAFVGLADDATAAYSNPAGLMNLSRPEVSVEGRRWKYTHTFSDRGVAFGVPGPDEVPLQTGESHNTVSGLSFISAVYPKGNGAVAFYRHELANFRADITTHGPTLPDYDFFLFPTKSKMELSIVNYGVSGAYRLGSNVSLGIGMSFYDFSLRSDTQRFDPRDTDNHQSQRGGKKGFGFNMGALWNVTSAWSLGVSYRQGPTFNMTATNVQEFSTRFNVPDVVVLGTALKPTDTDTFTVDYSKVGYSRLTENLADLFRTQSNVTKRLTVDDANEFHFGFEHVFVKERHPLSVRIGTWYDPDHKIRFEGFPADSLEAAESVLFRHGANVWHYCGGLGFVLGEKIQLDIAADLSKRVDTLSLSTVYRF